MNCEITSIEELTKASEIVSRKFGIELDVFWRGQASACWHLVPSVFRERKNPWYEQNLAVHFMLRAGSRHSNCPRPDDYANWLFLMQHYRLPTRLLDWSKSVLVATFFSLNEDREGPAALWALHPIILNNSQTNIDLDSVRDRVAVPGNPIVELLCRSVFEGGVGSEHDIVLSMMPYEIDPRMMAQLSAFTIHNNGTPLDRMPESEKYLIKFIIPEGAKAQLKRDLVRLGVREANLFPDLEHLSKELTSGSYSY